MKNILICFTILSLLLEIRNEIFKTKMKRDQKLNIKSCTGLENLNISKIQNEVRVLKYSLQYSFNKDFKVYYGNLRIYFQMKTKRDQKLIVHSNHNEINFIDIQNKIELSYSSSPIYICKLPTYPDSYLITFPYSLESEEIYNINFDFEGIPFQNEEKGIFIVYSQRRMHNGPEYVFYYEPTISTNFENEFAKEAFPCIDAPFQKANFRLTLTYNNYFESYSNTKIISVNFSFL